MTPPNIRCLALHTGGTSWVDVTITVGPRAGPLVRWLGSGWGLEMGSGLVPALEGLEVARMPDGRAASAFWLRLHGEKPAGTSADIVLAAAILIRSRAGLASARPNEPPDIVVTGSGTIELSESGTASVHAVRGWAEKLMFLERQLQELGPADVILLHAEEQTDELEIAMDQTGLAGRVRLVGVSSPDSLMHALSPLVGDDSENLPGWPRPTQEVARLIQRARALADQPNLGYLGLEHLAITLLESGLRGPILDQMRRLLTPALLRPALDTRVVLMGPVAPPTLTPAVLRLGARLAPGFDAERLAEVICDQPASPARVGVGNLIVASPRTAYDVSYETMRSVELDDAPFAGLLEVVFGPEGGRRMYLDRSEWLGRWAPEGAPAFALYGDTRLKDRALSRAHLCSLGGCLVQSRHSFSVLRRGFEQNVEPGQPYEVEVGDVLKLTPMTWLCALPEGALE